MTTQQTNNTAPRNNIDAALTDFYRNLGNGIKAAADLHDVIVMTANSRDTNKLAQKLDQIEREKGDAQSIRQVRFVISQVWDGARLVRDAKTKHIKAIKIKDVKTDFEAIERLNDAVNQGLSLRGDTFRKVVSGQVGADGKASKPVVDTKKKTDNYVAALIKENLSDAAIVAAVQASLKKARAEIAKSKAA